jgi:hypothetical protein
MTRMGTNGRGLDDSARRTRRARRDEEGPRRCRGGNGMKMGVVNWIGALRKDEVGDFGVLRG